MPRERVATSSLRDELKTSSLRKELKHTFRLSLPIVIANIGMISLGLMDTIMVGQVSATELAGVAAGNGIFWLGILIGRGFLLAMDSLVSRAVGAGHPKQAQKILGQGLWLSFYLAVFFFVFFKVGRNYYYLVGPDPEVLATTLPYLDTITWSLPFILFYMAFQAYWQAREIVMPMTIITISANAINFLGNLCFVWGYWGFPALGSEGVAYATLFSRIYMLACLLAYTYFRFIRDQSELPIRFDKNIQGKLLKLGLPSGMQLFLEVSAFSAVTVLSTKLGAPSVAAHQIALSIASFTFMVPLGLSMAGAVRVGTFYGAKKYKEATEAGWIANGMSAVFMTVCAIILILFPSEIFGLFTKDPKVIELGLGILFLAALFQLVDGLQVTVTGTLRGLGDTKSAMYANLIGHYPIGLAIGAALCFGVGKGLYGLWVGLSIGLFVVAVMLLGVWMLKTRALVRR